MFLQDVVKMSMQGFVKIIDKNTRSILVDTHNDVLYGNMSIAMAHSLIGNPDGFLCYMAFGEGGTYNSINGLVYRESQGALSGTTKNSVANLYNTVYVKKVSNDATSAINYDRQSRAYIPVENFSTNYEDIVIDVIMSANEPPALITPITNNITFDEIGLFIGSDNLFSGSFTQTPSDVQNFITQSPNFSTVTGTKSKLMLTHAIFQPITKVAIQSLEIIYTLRIQMG